MPTDEPGSVRGDLVDVEVPHDSSRPYRITLVGHRFAYDVALLDGSDPPALADLRLVALDAATAVEKGDLLTAGNVVDRLARIAARQARRGTADYNRAATERMRAGLVEKFGIDTNDLVVHSYEAPGPVLVPAQPKRRRGRPPLSTEFYKRVADAARDAAADPGVRSVWRGVQARAAQWPEIEGIPSRSRVERWLKVARKDFGYRGQRAKTPDPTTTTTEENDT
ncbi:MAG: hypothetical protein ACLPLP_21375 [Mycobacterium sp.]